MNTVNKHTHLNLSFVFHLQIIFELFRILWDLNLIDISGFKSSHFWFGGCMHQLPRRYPVWCFRSPQSLKTQFSLFNNSSGKLERTQDSWSSQYRSSSVVLFYMSITTTTSHKVYSYGKSARRKRCCFVGSRVIRKATSTTMRAREPIWIRATGPRSSSEQIRHNQRVRERELLFLKAQQLLTAAAFTLKLFADAARCWTIVHCARSLCDLLAGVKQYSSTYFICCWWPLC